jgi:hypothetical protein
MPELVALWARYLLRRLRAIVESTDRCRELPSGLLTCSFGAEPRLRRDMLTPDLLLTTEQGPCGHYPVTGNRSLK